MNKWTRENMKEKREGKERESDKAENIEKLKEMDTRK